MDWAVGGQRIGKLPSLPSLPRSFAHSLQMWPITAITSLRQPTRFENKKVAEKPEILFLHFRNGAIELSVMEQRGGRLAGTTLTTDFDILHTAFS